MTELDFDELDKAVSSLMAENGTPDTAEQSPVEAPTAPAPSAPTPPVTTASPAVRRRGQFMDVMHPSANMRPTNAPIKGQAATITPLTMQASVTPDDNSTPSDTPTIPTSDIAVEPVLPVEILATPLDVDNESEGEHVTSLEGESETSSAPHELVISEDPLSSPFLPDAKVEKRPLGTAAILVEPSTVGDAPEVVLPVDASAQPINDEVKLVEPVAEVPIEPVSLPDELKEDVVAVEANEVIHEDTTPDTPEQVSPSAVTTADVPSVGGNIVQQYEEQPSTGDQTNGAIYDTSTYHQPLDAKPAKKKSSALVWVLWIVVLLIVGATAGAAWFYFTTQ